MNIDCLFLILGFNAKTIGSSSQNVYFGGFVETKRGFVVHRYSRDWRSTSRVKFVMAFTKGIDILECIADGLGVGGFDALISVSRCGCPQGRLEKEIRMSAWLVIPGQEDLMSPAPIKKRCGTAPSSLAIKPEQISIEPGHI